MVYLFDHYLLVTYIQFLFSFNPCLIVPRSYPLSFQILTILSDTALKISYYVDYLTRAT